MKTIKKIKVDFISQFKKNRSSKHIAIIAICMFLLGILGQFVASFLVTTVLNFFPKTAEEYASNINILLQLNASIVLLVCVFAPIFEELIFRGLILTVFKQFCPFMIANIAQAVIFGIYHGNIVQGIYAFFLGFFIGYLLSITGSILYTMLFHGGINLMGLFIEDIVPESTPFVKTLVIALIAFILGYAAFRTISKYARLEK